MKNVEQKPVLTEKKKKDLYELSSEQFSKTNFLLLCTLNVFVTRVNFSGRHQLLRRNTNKFKNCSLKQVTHMSGGELLELRLLDTQLLDTFGSKSIA